MLGLRLWHAFNQLDLDLDCQDMDMVNLTRTLHFGGSL